jgi:hypothetical protein
MNQSVCSLEKEVLKAVRSRHVTDNLRAHAATCPVCSETIQVAALVHTYSSDHISYPFPNHRLIWLKAQYARKQDRISKFDIVALVGMWVLGASGFVGLLFWRFPEVFFEVIHFAGSSALDIRSVLSNGAPFAVLIGVLVTVWVLTRDSFFTEP